MCIITICKTQNQNKIIDFAKIALKQCKSAFFSSITKLVYLRIFLNNKPSGKHTFITEKLDAIISLEHKKHDILVKLAYKYVFFVVTLLKSINIMLFTISCEGKLNIDIEMLDN